MYHKIKPAINRVKVTQALGSDQDNIGMVVCVRYKLTGIINKNIYATSTYRKFSILKRGFKFKKTCLVKGMFKTINLKYKYREADKAINNKSDGLALFFWGIKRYSKITRRGIINALSLDRKAKMENKIAEIKYNFPFFVNFNAKQVDKAVNNMNVPASKSPRPDM